MAARRIPGLAGGALVLIALASGAALAEPPAGRDTAHGQAPARAAAAAHEAAESGHGGTGEPAEHEASHGPSPTAVLVNTILFFGLLGWFAGPWIVAWFRRRKAEIESELGAAQRARAEAESRLAEAERRLAAVEGEVEAILETAGEQAGAEKKRILAAAEVEAARVLAQAETQVGELETQAQRRLRETAADLAIRLARELVDRQLAAKDRVRQFDDHVKGLKKAAG